MTNRLLPSCTSVFCSLLLLFCTSSAEDDVRCLRGVKTSFTDPDGKLITSWNFSNTAVGFICKFVGVTCWNDLENRLISLELRDFNLAGDIPSSLQLCRSLQNLDLSGNSLSGPIPPQICTWLPYLVSLDLSRSGLTGQIPEGLVNCVFLSTLILDDNKLSGNIPYQLSNLVRLKKFSVVNNDLSGKVPSFDDSVELNYTGNRGLCSGPLGKCVTIWTNS